MSNKQPPTSIEQLQTETTNMALWNSVKKTERKYIKVASPKGYKMTTICPQSRLETATRLWGSMGDKWGIRAELWDFTSIPNAVFYRAELYYPNGIIPIKASLSLIMGSKFDDDAVKKVVTDAIGKGLSYLGFNADVYLGELDDYKHAAWEDDKYSEPTTARGASTPLPAKLPVAKIPAKPIIDDEQPI